MDIPNLPPSFKRVPACWNWKCALISAFARSIVYLAAMPRTGTRGGLLIVLVEILYVTFTAGTYAGLQQRALEFRSRILGNLTVVFCVPMLAQFFDWMAHRVAGAPVPPKATFAACVFATISALFHLFVMRRGAFLTGHKGRPLRDDFRRMPRLIGAFVAVPITLFMDLGTRSTSAIESEPAL